MTLTQRKSLHEILIRFDVAGRFQGAHVLDLVQIMDGTQEVSASIGQARGIAEAEVGPIIGDQSARLIEAVEAAREDGRREAERADSAETEVGRLGSSVAKLMVAAEESAVSLSTARAQVRSADERASAFATEVERLKADVARLAAALEEATARGLASLETAP